MKSIKDINKIMELRSLELNEHECNFLAAHFDELSRFFRKAVKIKESDNEPKRLVFMTPEGKAYERKSTLADVFICLFSIFIGLLVLICSFISTICMDDWTSVIFSLLLATLYGTSIWWLYHGTFKNLDKLNKWLCRKELKALRSEENKQHLKELQAGFTQKAVHKFVQHFYFDIYAKVFLSGWFYLSPRPETIWTTMPEHAMEIVVRRRSSPALTSSRIIP